MIQADTIFRNIHTDIVEGYKESHVLNFLDPPSHADMYIFNQPFYNNIHVKGYFENYENFDDIKPLIIRYFGPSEETRNHLLKKYPMVCDEFISSIHIRMGPCSRNHYSTSKILEIETTYHEMIDYMIQNKKINKFMVFTNDKEYCRSILENNEKYKILGIEFFYSEETRDFSDLWLISLFKNNIMSFSTLSWWGSYLNTNIGKCIVGSIKTTKEKLKYDAAAAASLEWKYI